MATYTSIHSGTAIDDAVTKIQNLDLDVELAPYATQTYVSNYLNNNNYVTQTQMQNTLTSGDYQTSTQVENRITNKGYATTTYVDGQIGGLALNKVLQSRSTSSSYRPILLQCNYADYGVDPGAATNSCYYNETISVKASTGELKATKVYGAVYNDYAEYRQAIGEPGHCVVENGDGTLRLSSQRLEPAPEIISDTFGFAIGETEQCKTPIAVAGRVLAYPNEPIVSYQIGDPVCSGPNGTISKMSREEVCMYPDRMIGTVSEIPTYDTWGQDDIPVKGRIWIRIR